MNPTEFKYRFSVLFDNIMSNAAPGMTDYEISYYLTKGQLELAKNYFNPLGNKYSEGLDGSKKRQADFSALIQTETLTKVEGATPAFDRRAEVYRFPASFIGIINESIDIRKESTTYTKQVVPISYSEYMRLMARPYKEPLKNQAWRLFEGPERVELITSTSDRDLSKTYNIRYVRYPKPIIVSNLHDLSPDLELDGEYLERTSELNEEMHEEIIQRAVELAKAAYSSDQSGQAQMQNQITVGQRSE